MKKNGWKIAPLLLALILAAAFLGCSKDEQENDRPTAGKTTPVEQYTFGGISDPSTTQADTEPTTKSASGGSYIGSGNSYMGGYQAANQLPTATPYGGSGSSTGTTAGTTRKSLSNADLSSILSGFTGSLSMDNLGDIKNFLSQSGVDMNTAEIARFISGLVDAKENGEKPDAGSIVEGVLDGIGNIGGS